MTIKKKIIKYSLIIFIFFFNYSCESIKKGLGMQKDAPDEFLIRKNEPIQMPPNYELLPPNSKSKVLKKKKNKSVKEIIDENLKKNNNPTQEKKIDKSPNSSNLEQEILKELNN